MMRPLHAYSPSPGGIGSSTANSNASSGRPIAKTNSPQLAGRTPRLPRLAGSPAPSVSSALRRDSRPESNNVISPNRNEDIDTPVKAFLSSNITPRSGSRKARVDSASSTPTGTPDGTPRNSRPNPTIETSGHGRGEANGLAGLGIQGGRTSRPGSLISDGGSSSLSFTPTSANGHGYGRETTSPESSPMFFHASEINAKVLPKPATQRLVPPARTQSFQYANGEYETEVGESPSSLSPPVVDQRPKLFNANATPEPEPSCFRFPSSRNSSRPQLETIPSAQSISGREQPPSSAKDDLPRPQTQQRPSSPLKDEVMRRKSSISKASPRRHTRLVSNGMAGELRSPVSIVFGGDLSRRSSLSAQGQSRVETPTAAPSSLPRRLSLSTPGQRNVRHARSSSANTIESSPGRRSIAYSEISPVGYKKPPTFDIKKPPMTDLPKTPPEAQSSPVFEQPKPPSSITPLQPKPLSSPHPKPPPPTASVLPPSQPQSPTKAALDQPPPGKSKLDHLNDLAASARRERKVLDLEISNSSLLAINQTLEHEMRKQALELRRFRRMSRRSGFSVKSRRTTGGESDVLSDEEENLSGEYSYDDEDASDLDSTDDTSLPDSSFSPSTRASSLPVPSRLKKSTASKAFLDLSRQRTLLIDSQKLNLALKRCLGRTEEMIGDAKKALEYRVRIDELEPLRGRVLTPNDEDGVAGGEGGKGLLSPSLDRGLDDPMDAQQTEGSEGIFDGSRVDETIDVESLGLSTPSPQDEGGGMGLGRYLGSLGESLGL